MEIEAKSVTKTITSFIDKIITPTFEEVGGLIADQIRFFRYKNQVTILLKAERFHKSKGINPKQIPVKTLASFMEGASLEENQSMQEKWAALLANATDPDNNFTGHLTLIQLLNQLTPDEAEVLDYMWKNYKEEHETPLSGNYYSVQILKEMKDLSANDKLPVDEQEKEALIIDNLVRLNLIDHSFATTRRGFLTSINGNMHTYKTDRVYLTTLGKRLIQECTFKTDVTTTV